MRTPIVCTSCGCEEFGWNDDTGLMYCGKCGTPLIIRGVHQSMYEEGKGNGMKIVMALLFAIGLVLSVWLLFR